MVHLGEFLGDATGKRGEQLEKLGNAGFARKSIRVRRFGRLFSGLEKRLDLRVKQAL